MTHFKGEREKETYFVIAIDFIVQPAMPLKIDFQNPITYFRLHCMRMLVSFILFMFPFLFHLFIQFYWILIPNALSLYHYTLILSLNSPVITDLIFLLFFTLCSDIWNAYPKSMLMVAYIRCVFMWILFDNELNDEQQQQQQHSIVTILHDEFQ